MTAKKNIKRMTGIVLSMIMLVMMLSSYVLPVYAASDDEYREIYSGSAGNDTFDLSKAVPKDGYVQVDAIYFPGGTAGVDLGTDTSYVTQSEGRAIIINSMYSPRYDSSADMAVISDGSNSFMYGKNGRPIWKNGSRAWGLISESDTNGNFSSSLSVYTKSEGTSICYSHTKREDDGYLNPKWDCNTSDITSGTYIDSTASRLASGVIPFTPSSAALWLGSTPDCENSFSGLIGKCSIKIFGPEGADMDKTLTLIPCIELGEGMTNKVTSWSSSNEISVTQTDEYCGRVGFYWYKRESGNDSEGFVSSDDAASMGWWKKESGDGEYVTDSMYIGQSHCFEPIDAIASKDHMFCSECGLYYDSMTGVCPKGHTLTKRTETGRMVKIIDTDKDYVTSDSDDVLNFSENALKDQNIVTYSGDWDGFGAEGWNKEILYAKYIGMNDESSRSGSWAYSIKDSSTGINMKYDITDTDLERGANPSGVTGISVSAKTGDLSNSFLGTLQTSGDEYVYGVNKSDPSTFVTYGLRQGSYVQSLLFGNNFPYISTDLYITLTGDGITTLPDLYFGYSDIDQGQAVRITDTNGNSIIDSDTRFYYLPSDSGQDKLKYTYLESGKVPSATYVGGYSYAGSSFSSDGGGTKVNLDTGYIFSDGSYGMDGGTVFVKIPQTDENEVNIGVKAVWSQEAVLGITPYTTGFTATYRISDEHIDPSTGETGFCPYEYDTDEINTDPYERSEELINGYDTTDLSDLDENGSVVDDCWKFDHWTADRPVTVETDSGTYTFSEGSELRDKDGNAIKDLSGIKILDQNVTFTAYFRNEETDVKIRKVSSIEKLSSMSDAYSLEGAQYGIYASENGNPLYTFTTDENGESEEYTLNAGTYYIRELKAPKGYALSDEIKEVELSPGESHVIEMSDTPLYSTFEIVKTNETDESIRTSRSLAGAVYRADWYSNISEPPVLTYYLATDENGIARLEGRYLAQGYESSELITLSDDENAQGVLPAGVVTVKEVKAPQGFSLDTNFYRKSIYFREGDTQNIQTVINSGETEIPDITIKAQKEWQDDDNRDGRRPNSVTLDLIRIDEDNTETVVQTITLRSPSWRKNFRAVPKGYADEFGDDGVTDYTYIVREREVSGYTSQISDIVFDDRTNTASVNIVNTRDPEKIKIEGEKTWDDKNDLAKRRPKSITVSLFADGEYVTDQKVTEGDDGKWKYEFRDLYKYSAGSEIKYTVRENDVFDYTPTYFDNVNMNILNTEKFGTLSVLKTDAEGSGLEGAEFEIRCRDTDKRIGVSGDSGQYSFSSFDDENCTLTTDSSGTLSVGDLPTGEYVLKEIRSPQGYMPYPDEIYFTVSAQSDEGLEKTVEIRDRRLVMPQSGGAGDTVIYIISGAVLMLAVLLIILSARYRKRKVSDQGQKDLTR